MTNINFVDHTTSTVWCCTV